MRAEAETGGALDDAAVKAQWVTEWTLLHQITSAAEAISAAAASSCGQETGGSGSAQLEGSEEPVTHHTTLGCSRFGQVTCLAAISLRPRCILARNTQTRSPNHV
jgi:hypothetical protein